MLRIAIDGPGGAGKSTIAKILAKKLDIDYIDTGAMYRAVGYKLIKEGIPVDDLKAVEEMLSGTDIDFSRGDTILDGQVISDRIRTQEISKMASDCSALLPVREKLVMLQKKMASEKSVIMDGRDIGTNVIKDAEFKFFLTAGAEERAQRRHKELIEKGENISFEKVLDDIMKRDHNDMTRKLNPLKKAEDAIEIDTTEMSIDEVVEYILGKVEQ